MFTLPLHFFLFLSLLVVSCLLNSYVPQRASSQLATGIVSFSNMYFAFVSSLLILGSYLQLFIISNFLKIIGCKIGFWCRIERYHLDEFKILWSLGLLVTTKQIFVFVVLFLHLLWMILPKVDIVISFVSVIDCRIILLGHLLFLNDLPVIYFV